MHAIAAVNYFLLHM